MKDFSKTASASLLIISITFSIIIFFGTTSWVWAEQILVDNLAESQVNRFPKDWKNYPFQKNKTRRVYKVQEENGEKFIQAVDKKLYSAPIFKDFNWNIKKYPYLKFKWRAQILPKGARESNSRTNDSACGVYVGFSRTRALKYVWSSSMSPGSFWAKKPGKFAIISKTMGPSSLGNWQEVTINVPEDYQRYFEKAVRKNPIGIGLLTDGNAVKHDAACDYADFRISSSP